MTSSTRERVNVYVGIEDAAKLRGLARCLRVSTSELIRAAISNHLDAVAEKDPETYALVERWAELDRRSRNPFYRPHQDNREPCQRCGEVLADADLSFGVCRICREQAREETR